MTHPRRTWIEPAPTPEEAAAIVAALEAVRGKSAARLPARSRWRLAGLLGRPVPPGREFEGSLWSYSGWEGRG